MIDFKRFSSFSSGSRTFAIMSASFHKAAAVFLISTPASDKLCLKTS